MLSFITISHLSRHCYLATYITDMLWILSVLMLDWSFIYLVYLFGFREKELKMTYWSTARHIGCLYNKNVSIQEPASACQYVRPGSPDPTPPPPLWCLGTVFLRKIAHALILKKWTWTHIHIYFVCLLNCDPWANSQNIFKELSNFQFFPLQMHIYRKSTHLYPFLLPPPEWSPYKIKERIYLYIYTSIHESIYV